MEITTTQAYLYGALISGALGFIIGLVPTILGIVRGKAKLGLLGLIASTAGGALLGLLLAIPVAAVFTWLVIRKTNPAEYVDAEAKAVYDDEAIEPSASDIDPETPVN